jgi:transcriptional regulator with XRE-family HTH domain
MGPMPEMTQERTQLPSPAIVRHRLGAQLRRLRLDRSVRIEDVAARLDVAPSTVSRIETGKAPARTSYVRMLLDLYGVDDPDQRRFLIDLAREGQRKGWWADARDLLPAGADRYLGLEAAASQVCSFAAQTVPALLRTNDYAAAAERVTRPGAKPDDIRRLAAVIRRRQDVLQRAGFQLNALIDEATLIRPMGSKQVLVDQLRQLVTVAANEQVTVQVIPLTTAWPVFSAPFAVLTFADLTDADVACTFGAGGEVSISSCAADVAAMRGRFTALSRAALTAVESACLISELARSPGGRAGAVARD